MSTTRPQTDRVLRGLLEDRVAIVTGAGRGIGTAASFITRATIPIDGGKLARGA